MFIDSLEAILYLIVLNCLQFIQSAMGEDWEGLTWVQCGWWDQIVLKPHSENHPMLDYSGVHRWSSLMLLVHLSFDPRWSCLLTHSGTEVIPFYPPPCLSLSLSKSMEELQHTYWKLPVVDPSKEPPQTPLSMPASSPEFCKKQRLYSITSTPIWKYSKQSSFPFQLEPEPSLLYNKLTYLLIFWYFSCFFPHQFKFLFFEYSLKDRTKLKTIMVFLFWFPPTP